jgi:hypothetical protein
VEKELVRFRGCVGRDFTANRPSRGTYHAGRESERDRQVSTQVRREQSQGQRGSLRRGVRHCPASISGISPIEKSGLEAGLEWKRRPHRRRGPQSA